jgi:hypothetical protein
MGCLIRVTTAPAKGELKTVIYVVAESKIDAAISILGRTIPMGAEIEPLGPVAGSFLRTLEQHLGSSLRCDRRRDAGRQAPRRGVVRKKG